MYELLSILVFAAFVVSQVAAVIAVQAEKQRPSETFNARFDHLLAVIRNSGG